MKETTGKVFRIADENQPVAGCTISKEVYTSGQDYISYFSLAENTDISAEVYGYHKLLILHEGNMEVYTDKEIFTLESGDCILTPTDIPVGMRTNTKAIYTEISISITNDYGCKAIGFRIWGSLLSLRTVKYNRE